MWAIERVRQELAREHRQTLAPAFWHEACSLVDALEALGILRYPDNDAEEIKLGNFLVGGHRALHSEVARYSAPLAVTDILARKIGEPAALDCLELLYEAGYHVVARETTETRG